jgi:hypothetical protein
MRHLLPALLLAPLAACFDAVDPEVEPADLQSGTWEFHLSGTQASGDCGDIAGADSGPIDAMAYIEVDDDEVTISLEGLWLEGEIEGNHLEASGTVNMGGDPYEVEVQSSVSSTDEGDEDDGDGDDDGEDDHDISRDEMTILPACIEPPEPEEEQIRVSIDADILAYDLLRGELEIRWTSPYGDCSFESQLVAVASDSGSTSADPVSNEAPIRTPEPATPVDD